jgi:hypothetical protein
MGSALVRAFCVTNHQHPHPHVTLCHVCHVCSHDVTTIDLFTYDHEIQLGELRSAKEFEYAHAQ